MSTDGWVRVSRLHPCPICGKADWCTVTTDKSAACCMRIESGKRLRNGGWLHRLREDAMPMARLRTRRVAVAMRKCGRDFDELAAVFAARIRREQLESLAKALGVSERSLRHLGVGFDTCAFTFPMRDGGGMVVGIRRRFQDGTKRAIRGSRNGMFVPSELSGTESLLICEGESDTASLLTLGFDCVGRPSCTGGTRYIAQLARGRGAIVVADADVPGKRGARSLASVLRLHCASVQIIEPPDGIKDARAWLGAGGTRKDVLAAIDAAPVIPLRTNAQKVDV
ncbi:MAG: hypothetical protein ABII12_15180 [Planctomycetota bacterium]